MSQLNLSFLRQHWHHSLQLLKQSTLATLITWVLLNLLVFLTLIKNITISDINIMNGIDFQEGLILFIYAVMTFIIHLQQRALLQSSSKVSTDLSFMIEKAAKNHFFYLYTLVAVLFFILSTFIPVMIPFLFLSPDQLGLALSFTLGPMRYFFFYLCLGLLFLIPLYTIHRLSPALVIQLIDYRLSTSQCIRCALKLTQSDFLFSFISFWLPVFFLYAIYYSIVSTIAYPPLHSVALCTSFFLPILLSLQIAHYVWLNQQPNNSFRHWIDWAHNHDN